MAISVWQYRIRTTADRATVARLLGEAWQANMIRRRSGGVQERGEYTYEFEVTAGTFRVQLEPDGSGTLLSATALRTRWTQTKMLFFIPVGPKEVLVNPLMKNVLETKLGSALRAAGYTCEVAREKVLL